MTQLVDRSRRWLFRSRRPNPIAAALNRATASAAALGLTPRRLITLEVPGRHSGRRHAIPVVLADHEGERYLVAMLGPGTQWVHNVQAANGHAVLRHGAREAVALVPVPAEERAPILKRYIALAPGARAHFPVDREAPDSAFAQIAGDYPVFRVVGD